MDVGFLNDRGERLFRHPTWFEEAREVTALEMRLPQRIATLALQRMLGQRRATSHVLFMLDPSHAPV